MNHLPTILKREPLVDALFEVRLRSVSSLPDVLPGILFREYEPKPIVHRLPAAELPQPIRANEPKLQFAPILKLELDKFFISVGDRSIIISCKLPYPKWPAFRSGILEGIEKIAGAGVEGEVERFSLKYVNLIEADSIAQQIRRVNMGLKLGGVEVENDHLNLQVHRREGDFVHILSVISGASGKIQGGKEVSGLVLEIDSIKSIEPMSFTKFSTTLKDDLEALRYANKTKFFNCLTQEAVDEMGPVYE